MNFNKPHPAAVNQASYNDVIAVTDYYNHWVKVLMLKGKLKDIRDRKPKEENEGRKEETPSGNESSHLSS